MNDPRSPAAGSDSAVAGAPGYRLTFGTKVVYGIGSIANGIKNQGLSAFVLLFFNQVMGLPAQWVGLAIMLALIVDAITDPLVGQWSDRLRTGWGRRHPLMYASALPTAIAFYLLWNPPQDLSNESLFVYLLLALIGVRLAITFYDIPSAALAPELAPGYDERAGIFAHRFFFGIVGGLAMTVYVYGFLLDIGGAPMPAIDPLAGPLAPEVESTYLSADGFGIYGLIGAIVIFLSIMITSLGTHRHIPYLHRPAATSPPLHEILRQIVETLWNRALIVIAISGLISAMAGGLSSGLSVYFGLYYWALTPGDIVYLIMAGAVASVIAVGLAPRLAKGMGKKPTVMVLLWSSLILGTAPIVGRMLDLMPSNGSPELLAILVGVAFLSGAMATMAAILISAMVADIVEDSQAKTGRRSEGLLFSADNILQKSIAGTGVFLSGLILAAVDFPANASPQTIDPEVLRNLALAYVPVTTALYVAAVACIHFYPIDRAKHEENLELIRARELGSDAAADSRTGRDSGG